MPIAVIQVDMRNLRDRTIFTEPNVEPSGESGQRLASNNRNSAALISACCLGISYCSFANFNTLRMLGGKVAGFLPIISAMMAAGTGYDATQISMQQRTVTYTDVTFAASAILGVFPDEGIRITQNFTRANIGLNTPVYQYFNDIANLWDATHSGGRAIAFFASFFKNPTEDMGRRVTRLNQDPNISAVPQRCRFILNPNRTQYKCDAPIVYLYVPVNTEPARLFASGDNAISPQRMADGRSLTKIFSTFADAIDGRLRTDAPAPNLLEADDDDEAGEQLVVQPRS